MLCQALAFFPHHFGLRYNPTLNVFQMLLRLGQNVINSCYNAFFGFSDKLFTHLGDDLNAQLPILSSTEILGSLRLTIR